MANRSTFPNQIDSFIEHFDISASDIPRVQRYQELKLKSPRTLAEDSELATLSNLLRDKIISPEDFNKFQDALVNMEIFIKDNVEGYITQKQSEFTSFVNGKKTDIDAHFNSKFTDITNTKNEFTTFVNNKETSINTTFNTKVSEMESKKNYFVSFVDTKEDEVRALVQEFDSNSSRYYQRWTATQGQTNFNIYYGGDFNDIPTEARLDIDPKNIDLIINGTTLTPYVDYRVNPDGAYDKIEILGNATLDAGTEVIAKWYKNVGKLYFKHSVTHGEGGTDPITVTRGMLDDKLKAGVAIVSSTAPVNPIENQLWVDTSV